jgi:hypothetical protein
MPVLLPLFNLRLSGLVAWRVFPIAPARDASVSVVSVLANITDTII